jgi:hypothetical protein
VWSEPAGRFASASYHLGNGYLRTQRPGKAVEAYRRAVVIDPGLVNGHIGLAAVLEAHLAGAGR